jgi:toxin secretion/phage lysis holin
MSLDYVHESGEGSLKHYFIQIISGFEWKILSSIISTIITLIAGFYSPLIWGFLGLFSIDFITGIIKSLVKGVPISSKRLRNSVTKLLSYMLLITSLIIASHYEESFLPVVTCSYYYFMYTELRSIIENSKEIGVKIPAVLDEEINRRTDTKEEESLKEEFRKFKVSRFFKRKDKEE